MSDIHHHHQVTELHTDINVDCYIVTNTIAIDSVWTNKGAASSRAEALNSAAIGEQLNWTVTSSKLNPPTAE